MKFGEKIFYDSESDKVVDFNIKEKKIDENYKYLTSNPLAKIFSWITYRLIATPLAFVYFKLIKRVKFHNAKILKKHKKGGYFIYANHTNHLGDGFCPHLICFPKKPHIVCNADNVNVPIIGPINRLWGALPLPNTINASKNFQKAIEKVISKNNPIVIYPEANLWPYHTKIRKFSSLSFRYPVKLNKPVFTFTTVYKLSKPNKKPRVEIYVDGPFYPKVCSTEKMSQEKLKQTVYLNLVKNSKFSNYEYVSYIRREND